MSATVHQTTFEDESPWRGQTYKLKCDGCDWEDTALDREAHMKASLHIQTIHEGDGGVRLDRD